jgi:hypothetical protein
VRIKYCSSPCGSGKTKTIIDRAHELVRADKKVLVLQPTRELIDRTVREEIESRYNPSKARVFHKGTIGDGKVSKALADYARQPPDIPEIVLATHQVLPHIKHFANRGDWHVLVDEVLQVVRYLPHRIPQTHELITEHLDVTQVNGIYGLVSARKSGLEDIAQNEDEDEIIETLVDTARILINPHWETFVNFEQYERLRRGEQKVLAFHSVLRPEILKGFPEVLMAAANFEDSEVFKVWGTRGVTFEPDAGFAEGLRYTKHPNGEAVTICYVTEQQWSRKRRELVCGEDGETVLDRMISAAKRLIPSGRLLWHANCSVNGDPFGHPAQRLPSKPHGLNSFREFDDVVFLSSLNPPTDHFRFLQSQGLQGGEVRAFTYLAEVYQAAMRGSLRDPNNRQPKQILVPDRGAAEYLQDIFPGCTVKKLDIGLVDDVQKRRGRPRRHDSNRERVARQRQEKRERKLKLLAEQFRLNLPDMGEQEDCVVGAGERGGSCAKNSIRLYTNFGTQPLTATLFSSVFSPIPFAYVSGEIDAFIDLLRRCHSRRRTGKQDYLFSPAIFDPAKSEQTHRGETNIAYLRHIVQDFENGELPPDELANIFPGLRMVVMNTFNHTADKPRFRVVFPTSEFMTPVVYGLINDCLADKLEDAGYSVVRGDRREGERLQNARLNARASGLDWSKTPPTSLFYLPCQAKAGDSFFMDFAEGSRQPLNPSIWIENMTVPLQPDFSPVQPATHPNRVIDEVLVQSAKETWRGSKEHPGTGNEIFFDFATSLRRAGMTLSEIEHTLRSEAQYGRSPKERLAQIPSIIISLRRYFVPTS